MLRANGPGAAWKRAGNSVHAQEPLCAGRRVRRGGSEGVCVWLRRPRLPSSSRPRWRRRAAEARGGLNLLLSLSLPQLRRFCRVSSAAGPASRSSQPPPEPARAQRRRRPPERESAQPGGPRAPRSPPAGAGAPATAAVPAAAQAAASASAPASRPPVTRPAAPRAGPRRPWPVRRETEAGEEGGSASPDRWAGRGPPAQPRRSAGGEGAGRPESPRGREWVSRQRGLLACDGGPWQQNPRARGCQRGPEGGEAPLAPLPAESVALPRQGRVWQASDVAAAAVPSCQHGGAAGAWGGHPRWVGRVLAQKRVTSLQNGVPGGGSAAAAAAQLLGSTRLSAAG